MTAHPAHPALVVSGWLFRRSDRAADRAQAVLRGEPRPGEDR